MNVSIRSFIREGWLQATISVATIIAAIIALYITSRLAPLTENLTSITTRVQAIEKQSDNTSQLGERVANIEGKLDTIKGDVRDLKNMQQEHIDIERKLNALLSK